MGGNKIRKLEFLLADAIKSDCDCVVTIGDEQSNHCRATASASRVVGMEPHLILRSSKDAADLGLVGNVLFDRVVGSQIYTCTPGEYGRIGSDELVSRLCQHLRKVDKKPYAIPVGGSNGLGSWGYINGVYELIAQWQTLLNDMSPGSTAKSLDHIVFACGSGGTAAGISLGIALATASYTNVFGTKPMVHAIGVCDDEEYFYRFVSKIADQMGFLLPQSGKFESTEAFIRHHLKVHQGKGLGYARSTPEELDFVVQFARRTGIVLDPVYTGKALKNFFNFVEEHPNDFLGKTILFWHTGGGLGLFGKSSDLHATLQTDSPCQRLDVYGKGMGIDVSSPINH